MNSNSQPDPTPSPKTGKPDGSHVQEAITPTPPEALAELQDLAERSGGPYEEPSDYAGSVGRTLFDTPASQDGTVTVVLPSESIDEVASQSLVRILSKPDDREYVGIVSAGPFAEPDGIRADSASLVISAVNRALMMPKFHGRLQASLLGEQIHDRLVPPRRRPKPNSPVWVIPDEQMAKILGISGDMRIGVTDGHEDIEVLIPSKRKSVLPRHQGILGTTGAGKSTTVCVEIDQFQKAGIATILLDTEGEYTTVNEATTDEAMLTALGERGQSPHGIEDTHIYYLKGRDCANLSHPDAKSFTLRLANISPWAFKEIMNLTEAQETRLMQAYEIGKELLRSLQLFPRKGHEVDDQKKIIDIDEFDRGWPCLTLEHLGYIVSGVINLHEKRDEEPWVKAPGFHGKWGQIKNHIRVVFVGGDDKKSFSAGHVASWKALSAKLARLRRLDIFSDTGDGLKYNEMIAPGRVNIIDLHDLENIDIRNLAIAEILRGVQMQQDVNYQKAQSAGTTPTPANIIIEEAHEFLSVHRIHKMPIMREQVERIAKRGRKRYLGLTFVTQLPQHLPDDILALLNNWVIHKISDSTVLARLRKSIHGVDDRLWQLIPGLAAGQAIVSFTHIRRALIASIDPSPARLRMID